MFRTYLLRDTTTAVPQQSTLATAIPSTLPLEYRYLKQGNTHMHALEFFAKEAQHLLSFKDESFQIMMMGNFDPGYNLNMRSFPVGRACIEIRSIRAIPKCIVS
jgi:hypothetical protein